MKAVAAFKLAYLYLLYWTVGLDEDWFQISKGNHLFDLGSFPTAAKAYQRALAGTQSASLHGRLGYCHLNQGLYDKALASFRMALEKKDDPVHQIGLAWSYLGLGEDSNCQAVVARLRSDPRACDSWIDAQLKELDESLGATNEKGPGGISPGTEKHV